MEESRFQENKVEGRNAVLEAFRSGRAVDKLFVLDGCQDGPVRSILREAKKRTPLSALLKKNGWIRCRRQGSTRV